MDTRSPTTLSSASAESTQSNPPHHDNGSSTVPGARLLLRADGLFEGMLGLLLISSPLTGLAGALDLPDPARTPVLVALGVLLLPVLPILWTASRAPGRQLIFTLAVANGAGSLIFTLWVLIWHATFHPAGAAFVLVVAAILAILTALQARAARITI
jgi:O-antigen/teichoic acid export membrane protein